jgi:glutamate-ammonia-ligase adenylyltransferase
VEAWRASTRQGAAAATADLLLPGAGGGGADPVRAGAADLGGGTRRGCGRWASTTPAAALRHIEALTRPACARRTEIQRQLLPAMLGWFAAGPNPDHGLLAFRQVSEALGETSAWVLAGAARRGCAGGEPGDGAGLQQVCRRSAACVTRRRSSCCRRRHAGGVRASRCRGDPSAEMRRRGPAGIAEAARRRRGAIRAVRRKELLRIAVAELLGALTCGPHRRGLSDVMTATDRRCRYARSPRRPWRSRRALAIVALGRWGGRELSYSSDADAHGRGGRLRVRRRGRRQGASGSSPGCASCCARRVPDPAVELDLDLRPEGKDGPMVRSAGVLSRLLREWSSTWEAQALVRAGHGAPAIPGSEPPN